MNIIDERQFKSERKDKFKSNYNTIDRADIDVRDAY